MNYLLILLNHLVWIWYYSNECLTFYVKWMYFVTDILVFKFISYSSDQTELSCCRYHVTHDAGIVIFSHNSWLYHFLDPPPSRCHVLHSPSHYSSLSYYTHLGNYYLPISLYDSLLALMLSSARFCCNPCKYRAFDLTINSSTSVSLCKIRFWGSYSFFFQEKDRYFLWFIFFVNCVLLLDRFSCVWDDLMSFFFSLVTWMSQFFFITGVLIINWIYNKKLCVCCFSFRYFNSIFFFIFYFSLSSSQSIANRLYIVKWFLMTANIIQISNTNIHILPDLKSV